MDKRTSLYLGILTGLVIAAALLVVAVWAWQFIVASALPIYTSTAPPASSTPASLPELTSRVEKLENDLAYTLRDIAWKMDQKLVIISWAALFISFVAGFVGIKTYSDLDKVIKEKVSKTLDQALYQVDPTNIPIQLPSGEGMEAIHRRLQLCGFKNISFYNHLDGVNLSGVIVVKMDAEKEANFRNFIAQSSPDPTTTAFILYAAPGSVAQETRECYENLVTANYPATVASMVLVVGRGLKPPDGDQT